MIVCIAEKGPESTDEINPVQKAYRDNIANERFNKNAKEIQKSTRRLLSAPTNAWDDRGEFIDIGWLGKEYPF